MIGIAAIDTGIGIILATLGYVYMRIGGCRRSGFPKVKRKTLIGQKKWM